jgi:NAD+ synthase
MGLPYELVHKVPSDGMCGKTDEDNLGFSYDELDAYIRSQPKYNIDGDKHSLLLPGVVAKIEKMHSAPNTKKKCIELDNPFGCGSSYLPTAF